MRRTLFHVGRFCFWSCLAMKNRESAPASLFSRPEPPTWETWRHARRMTVVGTLEHTYCRSPVKGDRVGPAQSINRREISALETCRLFSGRQAEPMYPRHGSLRVPNHRP